MKLKFKPEKVDDNHMACELNNLSIEKQNNGKAFHQHPISFRSFNYLKYMMKSRANANGKFFRNIPQLITS